MLRIIILIVAAAVVALSAEWIYRGFIRTIDPLAPEHLALAEHFIRSGINVRPYAIRHGLRHSQLLAAAGFEIIGYPLPIGVNLCPTEKAAIEMFERNKGHPNLAHRNGRLVMNLPMWGDDTHEMAAKVVSAFTSFAGGK